MQTFIMKWKYISILYFHLTAMNNLCQPFCTLGLTLIESKAVIAVAYFDRNSCNLILTRVVAVERYVLFIVVKLFAPVLRACKGRS